MSTARPFQFVAVLLLFLAGCSRDYDGERRFPLSGRVHVDGLPVDQGAISFIPTEHGTQRVSGGPILDGVYSVPEQKGANAGTYRVEVRWFKKTGRMARDRDGEYEERKEGVPKRYNEQSELKAEVSAAQTKFDYDLKSK